MKEDIFSVAQLFADTMSLPGRGRVSLCIFGRKYMCGVRTCLTRRMPATLGVVSFLSTISSMSWVTS